MLAGYFVGWRLTSFSCPSLLFNSIDFFFFNGVPFACFSKWVMWSDSTATRLSVVNHCFILKGVCLIFALCMLISIHGFCFIDSCFQKHTRQCFVLPSLSLICYPQLFVSLHITDTFGHCKQLFLIGTFAFDFFVWAVSCCLTFCSHTRSPRAFTGQEVAAFYWEKVSWLWMLNCWEQCFDGKASWRTKTIKWVGVTFLCCEWKRECGYISNESRRGAQQKNFFFFVSLSTSLSR